MLRYYTEYSNQVHQLNISLSKHFYCLKDGQVKYQEKPFDINWINFAKTGKTHLVHYIIRDHYSNAFYGEIHQVENMISIEDFLFNAWREKNDYQFRGVPKTLLAPRSVIEKFPKLSALYKNVSTIFLQEATSGFNAGVRIIVDWERDLRFITGYYKDCQQLHQVQHNIEGVNNTMNTRTGSKKTEGNIVKWKLGLRELIGTGSKDHFMALFKEKIPHNV